MNYSGDAAEQIVRFSLEGMEVALKISGNAAKEMAILLVAALKTEQKTAGKTRLTSMLKSGKELTVFSLPQKDLKKFVQEAKKYGVLYCTIRDRKSRDALSPVDIITRAEDAPKINRIVERFQLAAVDTAGITGTRENENLEEYMGKLEKLFDDITSQPVPGVSRSSQESPSERDLNGEKAENRATSDAYDKAKERKPSVRESLQRAKEKQKQLKSGKEREPKQRNFTGKEAAEKTAGKER